jgi:hypothetical protein
VLPVTVVNNALSPVIVAPLTLVVNVPDTLVVFEKLPVSPVINVPLTCVVNTPDTKFAVVPVVVVPVREIKAPVVANTVVPVTVDPLIVPVTVNPEATFALPSVNVSPENVRLPAKVWFTAAKF